MRSALVFFAFSILITGCAVPRLFWPQKDIASIVPENERCRVLIASRSSAFKDELVKQTLSLLARDSITARVEGIGALDSLSPTDFDCMLLISTCVAWKFDRHIDRFLPQTGRANNVIVVTTAGDTTWTADKKGLQYDAITSASVNTVIGPLSDKINTLIHNKLKKQ